MADQVCSILQRADSLYAMGQCDQAVAVLAKALDAKPQQPELIRRIAEFLIDSGEHGAALRFLQATESREFEDDRLYLMGICLEAIGQRGAAAAIADRMLAIEGQRARALVIRAKIAVRSGDPDLARKLFEDAIALDPGCGPAWYGLGNLWRQRDGALNCLECYEKALIFDPGSREVVLAFHDAALTTGNPHRAEASLRQALVWQPFDRRQRFLLIDVLLRQGKLEEAITEIETALADFGVDDGLLSAALSVRSQVGEMGIREAVVSGGTVSLCMIVKNEEHHLARCLKSVKPVVQEIVIVDTGSNDRTRQIATAFGARVFDFKWIDDFAKARNFSLGQASGEWILILDADEILSVNSHGEFRRLVEEAPAKTVAYSIRTRNYTHQASFIGWTGNQGEFPEEEGSGWFPSDKVRLFPNDPRIGFVNAVHELVEPSLIKSQIKIRRCPSVPIHHFGLLQESRTVDKNRAYLSLGRKKLKKNGRDPSALKELAIQSALENNHEEALRLWKKFLIVKPESVEAFLNMGSACWNLHRYPEAVQWAEKALRLKPGMKEGMLNKAVAYLMMGRAWESKSILMEVLENHPEYAPAQFMYFIASACSGDTEDARESFRNLQARPLGLHLGEAFVDTAKRMLCASQVEFAQRTIEAAVNSGYAGEELQAILAACRSTS